MRKYWYRRILIMITAFTVSVGGSYYLIQFQQKKLQKEVSAGMSRRANVNSGRMRSVFIWRWRELWCWEQRAVTDVNGMKCEPAEHLLKSGDYILALDEHKIRNKAELVDAVKEIDKEEVVLKVRRQDRMMNVKLKPVRCDSKEYNWVFG